MSSSHTPSLHVSECCRFFDGSQLEFETWLDLVGGVRWQNPDTGAEVRFEGIELAVPGTLNEPGIDEYCRFVAESVRRRGLRIGIVYPAVWRGSALGTDVSRTEYIRAVRIGAEVARTLGALGVKSGNILRLDTAASVSQWTAVHMTNNSNTIKYCVREAVELAASYGQRCALEMQCDLAVMNSPKSVNWLMSLVNRPELGVLADTAQLAYSVLGLNLPNSSLLPDGWDGNRQDFDRAYRTACAAVGSRVTAVHVSQTTLRTEQRLCGVRSGCQTVADDPAGILDLCKHAGMLLREVPEGLKRLDAIAWNGFRLDPVAASAPESLVAALQALDRIRQSFRVSVPCPS